MFADPQTVTYNAVAKSLPAISRSTDQSMYKLMESDGTIYDLTLGHAFKTRNRAFVRLVRTSYANDPLVPANKLLAGMTATLTVDFPTFGLTSVDAQYIGNALTGWASSGNLLKLITGET